jgi:hypothetical protein
MNPRRLIPYVVIFVVLAGAYAGLRWHQAQKMTREAQAKKVFHLTQTEISQLSLVRGSGTVSLAKKHKIWQVTAPLSTKADQTIVDNMLTTLAHLRKERDLGAQKDLKPFGLVKPALVVKFTAKSKAHHLAIGARTPGGENYYALADANPHILVISEGTKDSLDRTLLALRDKTLFPIISMEVKGLKVVTGKTTVDLKKTATADWHWVGRPKFKVRGDRVNKLVRDLELAQAKNFVEPTPKNLKPLGLVPGREMTVTVATTTGNHTLLLGAKKGKKGKEVYARKGTGGPVMLVDANLPAEITETMGELADHRLWSGAILKVHQMVWGPPGKTWTAKKVKENWEVTGPEHAATKQPSVRMEMALWDFKKLTAVKALPAAKAGATPVYSVELLDKAGKRMFRLDDLGPQGKKNLKVVTQEGKNTMTVLTAQGPFQQWQEEMGRLVAKAKQAAPAPKPGGGKSGEEKK